MRQGLDQELSDISRLETIWIKKKENQTNKRDNYSTKKTKVAAYYACPFY